ncbi:hypothetical protein FCV82_04675 [Vibrio breoganii]|uniref:hypothetical protein n=1 Tax=Vibrio breoganii TaxID=553239 RepID=UPI000C81FA21|nr:hypothetical protein [Vibrio breoganii]PMM82653.1 hypothetical protein BCT44_11350 [Vibrio breoganii]TKF89458.1 hypothetical protein FCV82_04675 [Vibrio breoganii]
METTYRNTKIGHLAAWAAVVLILIGVLIASLNRITVEAESTSVTLISAKALDKANYLRQYWELNGKPEYAEIKGAIVRFNNKGWVTPELDGVKSCDAWEQLLLPVPKQDYSPVTSSLLQESDVYSCTFTFRNSELLIVKMIGGNLSISKHIQ